MADHNDAVLVFRSKGITAWQVEVRQGPDEPLWFKGKIDQRHYRLMEQAGQVPIDVIEVIANPRGVTLRKNQQVTATFQTVLSPEEHDLVEHVTITYPS